MLQAFAGHVRFENDGDLKVAVLVWPERYEKVSVAGGNSLLQCGQLPARWCIIGS